MLTIEQLKEIIENDQMKELKAVIQQLINSEERDEIKRVLQAGDLERVQASEEAIRKNILANVELSNNTWKYVGELEVQVKSLANLIQSEMALRQQQQGQIAMLLSGQLGGGPTSGS